MIKNTQTIKHSEYREVDNAIWLVSYASGAKLRKYADIPSNYRKGSEVREEFVYEMIKFYVEIDKKYH